MKLFHFIKCMICFMSILLASYSMAQQPDTFKQGLRLTQSITHLNEITSQSNAAIVNMDYGSTNLNDLTEVVQTLGGSANPKILAESQSYGSGIYTIAQIEQMAKSGLLAQQETLLSKMRKAAIDARVSGAVWIFNQTVRPLGANRNMKIYWYLMLAPGGRVVTTDPKVVDEAPTLVYMLYYSKSVGQGLPASYGWAEGGLLKWQLRRYDGSPASEWSEVDTAGAYDSPESDGEFGPRCLATAETVAGCPQGLATARGLMAQTASRQAIFDYVRSVQAAYNPIDNGDSAPAITIAFDTRQYTRVSCTTGNYRCAGTVGYTVVESMDRYSMMDTQALPTSINSLTGLNNSRPPQNFDVNVSVSNTPAEIDPYVINPFDQPLNLVRKEDMPGVTRMAALQVEIPPTSGQFSCPAGSQLIGNQCVSTSASAPNVTYTCPNGSLPSGTTCTSTVSKDATLSTDYSCPSGGTLSGTTCSIASTSYAATASTSYSCSSGNLNLSGTSCVSTSTTAATATTTYSCPNGGTRSGTICTVAGSSYPATVSTRYSCNTGNLSGTNCVSTSTTAATATTTYSCPQGGTRSGTICTLTTSTAASNGNVSGYTSSSDMKVGSGSSGVIEFGTIADNYWGNGQYDRTLTVNIPDPAAVNEFRLVRAIFDDWVSLTVNGVFVGVAPYPGDRLERVLVETVDWNGNVSKDWQVRHGLNTYSPVELRRNWDMSFDIDLRPLLRAGNNSFVVRTIVGGWGESWVQFRASMKTCPSGSSLVSGQCVSTSTYTATASTSYSCSSGFLNGTNCISTSTTPAIVSNSYSCPNGGTLSGTTCSIASTSYAATASTSYSCSSGTLVGTSCVSTSTTAATATTTYSCPQGGTRSGTICTVGGSSYAASPSTSYSCSSGILSGSQCLSTITSPATPNFSCSIGSLNGSSCITQTSSPATWMPLKCPD